jgi:hypothetical protein
MLDRSALSLAAQAFVAMAQQAAMQPAKLQMS